MPVVRLVATGGTIASRSRAGGRQAAVPGADLVAAATLPDGLEVEVDDALTAGSYALTTDDLRHLVNRVRRALEADVAGAVVTHGTDTLEESAFFADLLHTDARPVVFTGAQRPFDDPSPDGPANLSAALRAAASSDARDCGVLVCFDGMAWPACGAAKVETLRAGAFAAPGRGPVLRITGTAVHVLARPVRPPRFAVDLGAPLPRVDVVPLYLGADATLLEAAVAAGARGLVLAAFGAGNANPPVVEAVRRACAGGVEVLVCSRVPSGPVEPLYAGGGGADLARAGARFTAGLSPWQARLLLAAALASGSGVATLLQGWLS